MMDPRIDTQYASSDKALPDVQAAFDAMLWLRDESPAPYMAGIGAVADQPSDHGYDFYDG